MAHKHRLPNNVVTMLEDAIAAATLTRASFDGGHKDTLQKAAARNPDSTVTDFIKGKVRLHHDSWIIGPIERVLDWSMSPKHNSDEYDLIHRLNSPFPNPAILIEAGNEIERLRARVEELERLERAIVKAQKEMEV